MSDGSSFLMLLRMGFSLAVVLGLIWVAARIVRKRNGIAPGGRIAGPGIEVVERRNVGRHGSVAVVRVAGRSLLVGITDTQVHLLTDLDAVDQPAPIAATSNGAAAATTTSSTTSSATAATRLLAGGAPVDVRAEVTTIDLSNPPAAHAATASDLVTRWIGSRGTATSPPTRMSLMDALRELTVRRI